MTVKILIIGTCRHRHYPFHRTNQLPVRTLLDPAPAIDTIINDDGLVWWVSACEPNLIISAAADKQFQNNKQQVKRQHYVLKPETVRPGDGKTGRRFSHIPPAAGTDRVPDAAGVLRAAPLVSAQGTRRPRWGRLQDGPAGDDGGVWVSFGYVLW